MHALGVYRPARHRRAAGRAGWERPGHRARVGCRGPGHV